MVTMSAMACVATSAFPWKTGERTSGKDRERVRRLVGEQDFTEIYCRCSVEICEKRDTKGLYKRARAGEVKDFTGISSPYEAPESPSLVLDTGSEPLTACVAKVIALLQQRGVIRATEKGGM
jgi:adenylylsulfate kinase